MTAYNVINPASLVAGQPEDVSQVLANLQAIAAVINGGIDASNITDGSISNAEIAVAAGIARSKLDFGSGLVNADIAAAAAIAYSKLALSNSIVTGDVVNNTLLAADHADGELLELLTKGTKRRISFGSGTMTFDGSGPFSNQGAGGLTVAHGLGATPLFVGVALGSTAGVTNFCAHQVRTLGSTNFIVQAETTDGQTPSNGSTQAFIWCAIG